jgi:hypothetical protein
MEVDGGGDEDKENAGAHGSAGRRPTKDLWSRLFAATLNLGRYEDAYMVLTANPHRDTYVAVTSLRGSASPALPSSRLTCTASCSQHQRRRLAPDHAHVSRQPGRTARPVFIRRPPGRRRADARLQSPALGPDGLPVLPDGPLFVAHPSRRLPVWYVPLTTDSLIRPARSR